MTMIGRTSEQQVATRELTAAARGYRILADGEGWPMSPGKYGRLEHLGAAPGQPGQLAAFTASTNLFKRLLAVPGLLRYQTGDGEYRVLLAPEAILAAARLLRCHRRRIVPPEQARFLPRPASRATSGAPEALQSAGACRESPARLPAPRTKA